MAMVTGRDTPDNQIKLTGSTVVEPSIELASRTMSVMETKNTDEPRAGAAHESFKIILGIPGVRSIFIFRADPVRRAVIVFSVIPLPGRHAYHQAGADMGGHPTGKAGLM